jgi:hypothetical protein
MLPGLARPDLRLLEAAIHVYKGQPVTVACQLAKTQLPGPGQYVGALQRVRQVTSATNYKYIDFAVQKGYNYGGSLLRRVFFTVASPMGLGLIAAGTAVIVVGGVIYVNSGDKPILPGPAMNKAKPEWKSGPGVSYNPDDYFVFVLPQVSGGSIYVGQESQLKEMHPCDMAGGGLCGKNDPPLQYDRKSPGFKTYEQATKAWCDELKGKPTHNVPVAGDSKADVYGGSYWIGTAPSCAISGGS